MKGNPWRAHVGMLQRAGGHAEPDDSQMPCSKSISKMASPSTYSNDTVHVLYSALRAVPQHVMAGTRSSRALPG